MLAIVALVCALEAGVGTAGSKQFALPACHVSTDVAQPFLHWNDSHSYFLASGGSMESDPTAAGWSLSGNAGLVAGSEPYDLAGSGDTTSLGLQNGSSAQTPPICVTIHDPELRFFASNTGKKDAVLKVTSLFLGTDGKPHTHDLGDVHAGSAWTLTQPLRFKDSIQPGPDGTGQVSFVFTPKDDHGNWQIDDLYVDPLKSQ
jgi:hypothetical protein